MIILALVIVIIGIFLGLNASAWVHDVPFWIVLLEPVIALYAFFYFLTHWSVLQ